MRDLSGVSGLPLILAFVLMLLACGIIAHTLLTSVRRRRRDLAILKTVGFVTRQVRATVAWQATALACAGLIVGVPLGLLAGRWAWILFASQEAIVPAPVISPLTLLAIPAVLLLANAIAAIPARSAARTQPASDPQVRVAGYSSRRVPTAFGMYAAGKRSAKARWAAQPVQCAGTRKAGDSRSSSAQTWGISGSNSGPPRWKPPTTACTWLTPVSLPRVPGDVDDAGVPAAGEHDQALAAHVHDQRLVVEHQRVRLPPPAAQRLLRREAGLEP